MKPIPKSILWNNYTFSQKIGIYKKFLGEEYAPYVDKITAKEIVSRYDIKTANIIKILKNIDDITINDLYNGTILKSSHASGWNIDLDEIKDINFIKNHLVFWNKPFDLNNEPHYKFITPRFFIEEKITDKYFKKKGSLVYMIRCIYGNPIPNIRVRYNKKANSYDFNWNMICNPELDIIVEKPVHLEKMIRLASEMSKEFEFVRMDFYIDENDDIYFSEYTFTPGGGSSIGSAELELMASRYWRKI